jgi:far upstream element-binding protein
MGYRKSDDSGDDSKRINYGNGDSSRPKYGLGSEERQGGGYGPPGGGGYSRHSVEITIPNSMVGLVIGKGGESLKNIERESGAKVQFSSGKPLLLYFIFSVPFD